MSIYLQNGFSSGSGYRTFRRMDTLQLTSNWRSHPAILAMFDISECSSYYTLNVDESQLVALESDWRKYGDDICPDGFNRTLDDIDTLCNRDQWLVADADWCHTMADMLADVRTMLALGIETATIYGA